MHYDYSSLFSGQRASSPVALPSAADEGSTEFDHSVKRVRQTAATNKAEVSSSLPAYSDVIEDESDKFRSVQDQRQGSSSHMPQMNAFLKTAAQNAGLDLVDVFALSVPPEARPKKGRDRLRPDPNPTHNPPSSRHSQSVSQQSPSGRPRREDGIYRDSARLPSEPRSPSPRASSIPRSTTLSSRFGSPQATSTPRQRPSPRSLEGRETIPRRSVSPIVSSTAFPPGSVSHRNSPPRNHSRPSSPLSFVSQRNHAVSSRSSTPLRAPIFPTAPTNPRPGPLSSAVDSDTTLRPASGDHGSSKGCSTVTNPYQLLSPPAPQQIHSRSTTVSPSSDVKDHPSASVRLPHDPDEYLIPDTDQSSDAGADEHQVFLQPSRHLALLSPLPRWSNVQDLDTQEQHHDPDDYWLPDSELRPENANERLHSRPYHRLPTSSPHQRRPQEPEPDDVWRPVRRLATHVQEGGSQGLQSSRRTSFFSDSDVLREETRVDNLQGPSRLYQQTPHDPDDYITTGLRETRQKERGVDECSDEEVWVDAEGGYDGGAEDDNIDMDVEDGKRQDAGADKEGINEARADYATKDDLTFLRRDITKALHDQSQLIKEGLLGSQSGQSKPHESTASTALPQKRSLSGRERQSRSIEAKTLADLVRRELTELFAESDDKVFGPSPSAEETANFAEEWRMSNGAARARAIESFCIDIRGTAKTPWNRSMGRVFARHIIQKHRYPDNPTVLSLIEDAFFARFRTLHAKWNSSVVRNPGEVAAEKVKGRSYQRKKADFDRRSAVLAEYPSLQKCIVMLRTLNIVGMSSDESDSSEGEKRYYITRPDWRSVEFRAVMGALDVIHNLTRASKAKADGRGQHVRRRHQSTPERVSSRTSAPRRLPVNFYNADWLKKQPPFWVQEVLQPRPKMDIAGIDDILKLMTTLSTEAERIRVSYPYR